MPTKYVQENIRGYELQSVNQAMDLIDALIAARDGLTLSNMSRSFGLSKNKIFRILSTLEQRGLVEKDRDCQYRLGITAFGTAHRILSSQSMLDHARPIMIELAARLNEAVYLATMLGTEAMFQEMIDCRQPIKIESFVGSSFPVPDAAGACSTSSRFDVEGMQVSVTELNEEVTAVSAPLTDDNGTVTGALVVLAPTFRIPLERILSVMALPVGAAALELSQKLGAVKAGATQVRNQLKSLDYSDKPPEIHAARPTNYQPHISLFHH